MHPFVLRRFPAITARPPGMLIFALAVLFAVVAKISAAEHDPLFFKAQPGALVTARAHLAAGDRALRPAFDKLIEEADKALEVKPISVMEKTRTPPGGSKHDYLSQAPYFWPDPAKPDGLPYIRKDGKVNPESHNEASDSPRLSKMGKTTETLALAYYFSAKDKYAEHAARLLRVWFLDPETKMNPHFNYAQAILGVNSGRGTGMIESRNLTSAADAAGLLEGSKHWSQSDAVALKAWMSAFVTWAQTSKNGTDEQNAKNNHGSFYDMQIAHLALYTGQTNLAKAIVESARKRRIAIQIQPDGSQPLELARADSYGYSRFNVQALFGLAIIGDHVGVDLWRYQTPEGAGVRKALDFLMPYAEDPQKSWPYEHDKKPNCSLAAVLRIAWQAYGDDRYRTLLAKSPDSDTEVDTLLFPGK